MVRLRLTNRLDNRTRVPLFSIHHNFTPQSSKLIDSVHRCLLIVVIKRRDANLLLRMQRFFIDTFGESPLISPQLSQQWWTEMGYKTCAYNEGLANVPSTVTHLKKVRLFVGLCVCAHDTKPPNRIEPIVLENSTFFCMKTFYIRNLFMYCDTFREHKQTTESRMCRVAIFIEFKTRMFFFHCIEWTRGKTKW